MGPPGRALFLVGATLLVGARAVRPEQMSYFQGDLELVAVEGRGNMAKGCKPFQDKRVVLVTVTSDYFDMFTNWLKSAKPFLLATEHLHIIAEDEKVLAPLEAFLEGQVLDFSMAPPQEAFSVLSLQPPYGSRGYGSVVWKRPRHILHFLQAGCSVLYVDIDTVWMKDPFKAIDAVGSGDLYLSDDSPPVEGRAFRNFCTCFMYVHPAGTAKRLLESWATAAWGAARKPDPRNQGIFNHVLENATEAHSEPHLQVLPMEQFPPGNFIHVSGTKELREDRPSDPTGSVQRDAVSYPFTLEQAMVLHCIVLLRSPVYHANWRMGQQAKITFFSRLGQWNPAPSSE